MAELQKYPEEHPNWKDKVVLIAASVDKSPDLPIPRLKAKGWDNSHNVWVETAAIKAYHIDAVPTIYVINPNGVAAPVSREEVPVVVDRLLDKRE